jgi:undecaprenol kinase
VQDEDISCWVAYTAAMKNKPFLKRLRFSLAGLVTALRSESSLRLQVVAALVVLGALIWLRPAPIWWALFALTIGSVLATELLNTAVEHLADHLHPEIHPTIKIVKDCAAAAVLVWSLAALAVAAALLCELAG